MFGSSYVPELRRGILMTHRRSLCTALFFICTISVVAQDLPKVSRPEEAGFGSDRLNRITQFFQSQVDKGAIPGAVVVVGRNGKIVYRQAIGYQDREKKLPMKVDSVFRIFSMTKPVTSVAVMMLAEEGKIDVMAPVAQYLPEFKDVKVGVEKMDPAGGKAYLAFEPPVRPMTVQDLLRHTSGLVYGPFGNTLVHQEYNKANLFDPGQTLEQFVSKLSKLPLAHQPGTAWEYGMNTDVLGRIVEVVSGMPFDRFVEERVTQPLKMPETAFYMEPAKLQRVAQLQIDPATGKRPEFGNSDDLTKEKLKWFSGGGGLLSTASDYARFCQMLVNGGELDGVRLLSPKTLALMTSDQVPPHASRVGQLQVTQDLNPFPEIGQSFGLGFAVRTDLGRSPASGSVGDYFWAGAAGTYFWVDPQEKMYVVMMLQMPFTEAGPYRRGLRQIVYGSMLH
jgi:CubicO group peptidase (beta-lactamase class C family)